MFSGINSGASVLGHVKDAKKISEKGWERIKEACNKVNGVDKREKQPKPDVVATLATRQGDLWFASSPPPEEID